MCWRRVIYRDFTRDWKEERGGQDSGEESSLERRERMMDALMVLAW
jgi:hypothetical protein